jgi:hypothetical protein
MTCSSSPPSLNWTTGLSGQQDLILWSHSTTIVPTCQSRELTHNDTRRRQYVHVPRDQVSRHGRRVSYSSTLASHPSLVVQRIPR